MNGEVLKPRQKLSSLKLDDESTFFLKLKKSIPAFSPFSLGSDELDENKGLDATQPNHEEKKEDENDEKEQGTNGPNGDTEEKETKKDKKEEFKGFAVTRKDIVDKVRTLP